MGKPEFYDFCVHAVPDGANAVEELSSLSRHLGYSGIALANHSDKLPSKKPVLSSIEGFEVFRGIELVEENPSKLHGLVGKFRSSMDVLIVHGGSEAVNRAALENPRVDILNHPAFDKSSGLNQVLAKAAADNGVAIGITLRPLYIPGVQGASVCSLTLRQTLSLPENTMSPLCCAVMPCPAMIFAPPWRLLLLLRSAGLRRMKRLML